LRGIRLKATPLAKEIAAYLARAGRAPWANADPLVVSRAFG
jgi:hypothetical protein